MADPLLLGNHLDAARQQRARQQKWAQATNAFYPGTTVRVGAAPARPQVPRGHAQTGFPAFPPKTQAARPQGDGAEDQQGPPAAGVNTVTSNYSGDPLLQRALQANTTARDATLSDADEDAWKLLLGFGSQQLADRFYKGDPRVKTVTDNPAEGFTVLGEMARDFDRTKASANEQWNSANLFYSGARNEGLGELGRGYLKSRSAAEEQVASALSQLFRNKAAAEVAKSQADLAAEQAAYERALAAARDGTGGVTEEQSQAGADVGAAVEEAMGGDALKALQRTLFGGMVAPAAARRPATRQPQRPAPFDMRAALGRFMG